MVKTFSTSNIELQRKRSTIALTIRLILFLGVTTFFFGYYHFNLTGKCKGDLHREDKNNYGRKLLSTANSVLNHSIVIPISELSSSKNENISVNLSTSNDAKFPKPAETNCTPSAILELPGDGLNRIERKQGWIIIHIILSCYCFWFLAAVCDDYFVPSIELICKGFQMNEDVIGATFMAAATSSPELFINCIGTFVTKGDIGIGTIVGSAVFNVLAVPACCGLFANHFVQLDWWPVTRDCLMYCLAVLGLIATLYDGKVMWFEALLLVLAYFVYITAMYYNNAIARKTRILISKYRYRKIKKNEAVEITEITPLLSNTKSKMNSALIESAIDIGLDGTLIFSNPLSCDSIDSDASTSGDTLNIPDSVMGLTILAAGMSIPEAVSSVIVTNQGYGGMGISNSIGSNTFDILLCLGLPWLIKAYFFPTNVNEYWVVINSTGLTYSAIFLLITLLGLYLAFLANKFFLDWKMGVSCTIMYGGFLLLGSMIQLNFFSKVNLPTCDL